MSRHRVNGILCNRAEKENLGEWSFDELCPGLEAVLEEAEAKRHFEINVSSTYHSNISTASDAESAPPRKKQRRNGPGTYQEDMVNFLEKSVLDAVQDLTTKATDFKDAHRELERMSGTGSTPERTLAYQKSRVNDKRTAILDGVKDMSSMWRQLQKAKEGLVPHG